MYAEERHQWILAKLNDTHRVDVVKIASELDVTPETIRKDLAFLETQGKLKRVHGGAIALERLFYEPTLPSRDSVLPNEKERIAIRALEEVPEGGSIILDAGSTTARLAALLPRDRELLVVTNSLPIAALLADSPSLNVMLIGGRLRQKTMATVDSWALEALGEIRVSIAFMGTNGISLERGFTTADPGEAAVKRAMVTAANRTVVLADHTKVGEEKFVRFASIHDADELITSEGISQLAKSELESSGLKVVVV